MFQLCRSVNSPVCLDQIICSEPSVLLLYSSASLWQTFTFTSGPGRWRGSAPAQLLSRSLFTSSLFPTDTFQVHYIYTALVYLHFFINTFYNEYNNKNHSGKLQKVYIYRSKFKLNVTFYKWMNTYMYFCILSWPEEQLLVWLGSSLFADNRTGLISVWVRHRRSLPPHPAVVKTASHHLLTGEFMMSLSKSHASRLCP